MCTSSLLPQTMNRIHKPFRNSRFSCFSLNTHTHTHTWHGVRFSDYYYCLFCCVLFAHIPPPLPHPCPVLLLPLSSVALMQYTLQSFLYGYRAPPPPKKILSDRPHARARVCGRSAECVFLHPGRRVLPFTTYSHRRLDRLNIVLVGLSPSLVIPVRV